MQKWIYVKALSLLVLLTFSFVGPNGRANAAQCLQAGDIRQAVSEGRAMSLAAITQTANAVVEGEVVKANLCSSNGRLVYEVVVLSRQGNVSRLILDAKSGKTISVNE